VEADLGSWRPPRPADLLFSNAALHWLDGHERLFPRLIADLAPGGVLAVQMPRNHGAPSHTEMVAAAEAGPWRARLRPLLRARPVAEPSFYYDVLAPHVSRLDIWETEYLHVLDGARSSVDRDRPQPLLDGLEEHARRVRGGRVAGRAGLSPRPEADPLPFRLFIIGTAMTVCRPLLVCVIQ
jgi:trans-aconitate 2-methyltransferase